MELSAHGTALRPMESALEAALGAHMTLHIRASASLIPVGGWLTLDRRSRRSRSASRRCGRSLLREGKRARENAGSEGEQWSASQSNVHELVPLVWILV
jgi:hypothetical protein